MDLRKIVVYTDIAACPRMCIETSGTLGYAEDLDGDLKRLKTLPPHEICPRLLFECLLKASADSKHSFRIGAGPPFGSGRCYVQPEGELFATYYFTSTDNVTVKLEKEALTRQEL